MNPYNRDADDFYVDVVLNTEMELPTNRDTVLHFFEQLKKGFPDLRNFHTRENGDLVLEGDREEESYRWVAIEPRRLCSGQSNPDSLDDAYRQHEMVLDLAPPLLTISLLDCEALDVMFGFDFTYDGNHDEVVTEALGVGPAPGKLARAAAAPTSSTSSPRSPWPWMNHVSSSAGWRSRRERTPYQVRTGRVRRRSDQRLLHGPPVLGQRPRPVVPRFVPPPARGRRRSSPPRGHSAHRPAAGPGDRLAIDNAGGADYASVSARWRAT